MKKYFWGTGRRKTSIAQVRISKGSGKFNLISDSKYSVDIFAKSVLLPLEILGEEKKYDVSAVLSGGGVESQKDALRLGVARALSSVDEQFAKTLKKQGLLTRDPREKERKKPGLKRARRAPQWQKR